LIAALVRNVTAREFYQRVGFTEQIVMLTKRLSG
jgi:predicted GNAT family acetyltransferase